MTIQPDLQEVRTAFLSAQQSLRELHKYPLPLLSLATFRLHDASGHANINQAFGLLAREINDLAVKLQNYRASVARPD